MKTNISFFTQLQILTKRLVLRVIRRPLAELPNIFISAFFLFVYDGALGGVLAALPKVRLLILLMEILLISYFQFL